MAVSVGTLAQKVTVAWHPEGTTKLHSHTACLAFSGAALNFRWHCREQVAHVRPRSGPDKEKQTLHQIVIVLLSCGTTSPSTMGPLLLGVEPPASAGGFLGDVGATSDGGGTLKLGSV